MRRKTQVLELVNHVQWMSTLTVRAKPSYVNDMNDCSFKIAILYGFDQKALICGPWIQHQQFAGEAIPINHVTVRVSLSLDNNSGDSSVLDEYHSATPLNLKRTLQWLSLEYCFLDCRITQKSWTGFHKGLRKFSWNYTCKCFNFRHSWDLTRIPATVPMFPDVSDATTCPTLLCI